MLPTAQWQIVATPDMPDSWVTEVQRVSGFRKPPPYGAQLLWQRGIRTATELLGFLKPAEYQPTSPFAFDTDDYPEMTWAVERLIQARNQQEKVAIWGDFDADGVTSTAVLWDGLGSFFAQQQQLFYFIPNRLKESHGLSCKGLDILAAKGVQLIVTCDTGSTNLEEIAYAQTLGMEVIVTDHHTLPPERPPVVAIINSRYLAPEHPLANLSGVAVAFKLVEALYERLPEVPQQPLGDLLDLVAIGLIADLVKLTGDCRYLAQVGIQQLQTHLRNQQDPTAVVTRPGVARLLELCRRTGDRPTDISFGLGPRINAVSRIHGDASFCVELLTSRDVARCRDLAEQTELANARRKSIQNEVLQQVKRRLEDLDLSTSGVIVLADTQWQTGVLGIVAGQVAQEYGKPAILLTLDEAVGVARGSARSVNQIDLYELVAGQAHLLSGFGGHPFAAGMSLPLENVPVFTDAVNRELRQQQALSGVAQGRIIQADLTVTVSELGQGLFKQISLLEPCGMGNAAPKLLIKDAWFENIWHQKIKDPRSGRKLQYIKASFVLKDATVEGEGFPGTWWGHYKDDLPPGRWDVIAELDFNSFTQKKRPRSGGYEIRLIDIRPAQSETLTVSQAATTLLIDQRPSTLSQSTDALQQPSDTGLVLTDCPATWKSLRPWFHQAQQQQQPLVLAYGFPQHPDPLDRWQTLVGLAKYLRRTAEGVTLEQLATRLEMTVASLQLGLKALQAIGFGISVDELGRRFNFVPTEAEPLDNQQGTLQHFLMALQEEQFRRQYFCKVPLATAQTVMTQTAITPTVGLSMDVVDDPVTDRQG